MRLRLTAVELMSTGSCALQSMTSAIKKQNKTKKILFCQFSSYWEIYSSSDIKINLWLFFTRLLHIHFFTNFYKFVKKEILQCSTLSLEKSTTFPEVVAATLHRIKCLPKNLTPCRKRARFKYHGQESWSRPGKLFHPLEIQFHQKRLKRKPSSALHTIIKHYLCQRGPQEQ